MSELKDNVSKIENEVRKITDKRKLQNVTNEIYLKIASFVGGTLMRVFDKFQETKNKSIDFNINFDFNITQKNKDKNFTEFDITASAESIMDDELLKIEDFIK